MKVVQDTAQWTQMHIYIYTILQVDILEEPFFF